MEHYGSWSGGKHEVSDSIKRFALHFRRFLTMCNQSGCEGWGWGSQETLCEDHEMRGEQRGPTFTFVVNLHLKWNQTLSVGNVSNIQIFSMHVYCLSFMSFMSKSGKNDAKPQYNNLFYATLSVPFFILTLLVLNRPPDMPAKTPFNLKLKFFGIFAHKQPV